MAEPIETRLHRLEQKVQSIQMARNIEIVELSLKDTVLIGKFSRDSKNIFIECDATDGNLIIIAPDAKDSIDIIFRFRKSDTTSNTVTIKTIAGQKINETTEQCLRLEGDNMPIGAIKGNWKKL